MGKEQATCVVEGGTYDGTPSGLKRHQKTKRHMDAVAAANLQPVETEEKRFARLADEWDQIMGQGKYGGPVLAEEQEAAAFGPTGDEEADETRLAELKEQLRRRMIDLGWRQRHRPDIADAYAAKKVQPLLDRIAELQK